MSSTVFNSENPFWQAMGRLADLFWLNILFLVAIIPLVTGGAAFTALYDTAWRLLGERGASVSKMFWKSFRDNFPKATALWAIVGPIGLAVIAGWIFLPPSELTVLRAVLTLVYLLVFPYFFYLQARFDNSFVGTLKNSILVPLSRLPYAVGILVVTVILVALVVATIIYIPQLLPPLLLGGFGLYAYAVTPLLNQSVKPWISKVPDASDNA